ncbi:PVC-type heme-binding CxxCH protein [Candidatus Laterigemmans baculatus]|uniref:PVC-type heme-binding CxxCH protein n=1 Tax=Candidatus Laterigemmans baculatus TaxID=2770505 RepID=UPI0013DD4EE5|nr:PVC-type heme-binding CxxCH protein [Candidatus Laterigemmans baculatus]
MRVLKNKQVSRSQRGHFLKRALWVALAIPAALSLQAAVSMQAADGVSGDPRLPRIEPLEPAEAAKTFDVAPGYRVELVAAEPLVVDPVAFCFDALGRLVVVEMRDYSERPNDHMGRLRRLTDTDGDGQMDEAETLAEGLSWPTAVACWGDGYLVAAAPDILYIGEPKDGEPVEPELWFTGFRRSNVQGLVNSLRWGPDNRIHGATSSSGADVQAADSANALPLGRRDFAIEPLSREFEAVPGGGQHGMVFNAWGDKFVCSNSDHLQQVLMVAGSEGVLSATPPMRRSIAVDGPQADVYRASPVEPWRVLRTELRVSGAVPGVVEGGGRAAGYFTGATGVYVYDGDQWFDEETDLALVCDVGSNLVHRKRLTPDGVWWEGTRIDKETELLRSSDIWFRPVQLGNGPDGAVYIADMYREVIEHPASLPPQIKQHLDLNSGNDRGRIWRLVKTDRPLRREVEPLETFTSAELVPVLDHPNAWHRRTAARLLYERQPQEVIPQLRALVREGKTAAGRLQAMQTLAGLPGGLDGATVKAAWNDTYPRVRSWAVRFAGGGAELPLEVEQIAAAGSDDSIHVRFQLALHADTLVEDEATRAALLWEVARQNPSDAWIRWAVEGSLGSAADAFLDRLAKPAEAIPAADRAAWLRATVCQLLHTDEDGIESLVRRLEATEAESAERNQLMGAIAAELRGLSASKRGRPLAEWISTALDPTALEPSDSKDRASLSLENRLALLQWSLPAEETRELLVELLHPSQPIGVQKLAMQRLVGNDAASLELVLDSLGELTPGVREAAWGVLKGQRQGLNLVAAAVIDGSLEPRAVPADVQTLLNDRGDAELQKRLAEGAVVMTESVPPEILQKYTAVANTPGDATAGRETFKRICAACHRAGGEGQAVGPDLRSVLEKSNEQLLIAILDPNREVDLRFQTVVLETASGQILSGVVESETDASVSIVDSQGVRTTVPRGDIEQLRATGRSLMPEGLHKEIPPEVLRDLLAFLRASQS